jgi:hypothetical protein
VQHPPHEKFLKCRLRHRPLSSYVNMPDNHVDLSDRYVDLSIDNVDLSDNHVDLSYVYVNVLGNYVDLSDVMSTSQKNMLSTGWHNW